MNTTKTILATAYAVNPYKGSEDGMGWNFVLQIARFQKVIAITRANNQAAIEQYMQANPKAEYENLQYLYFDLPKWMRFWKKGSRGAMLYYWMWQRGIVGFIRKAGIYFDIVHNVNFHNDWTISYLHQLGKPFVWGPIGHHPLIPSQFLAPFRKSYYVKDRLAWLVKNYFWRFSPSFEKAMNKASYVIGMNHSVCSVLPVVPQNYCIMPSVATEDLGYNFSLEQEKFTVISAGRLVPLKGFDLTIRSFAAFYHGIAPEAQANAELRIIGQGPELSLLQKMASELGVEAAIKFIPWMERKALMGLFQNASCFLFPSHEGAGMVVAEALSFGLPVVCLDNCGPGEFVCENSGFAVPVGNYNATVSALTGALLKLYQNPQLLESMRNGARARFETNFQWDVRGVQLNNIYQSIS